MVKERSCMQRIQTILIYSTLNRIYMLRSFLIISIICIGMQQSFAQDSGQEFEYNAAETDVNYIQEAKLIEHLKLDPEAFQPNYNLAAYYYNKGVEALERLSKEPQSPTPEVWDRLESENREVVALFNKALEPALIAFRRNQKHNELLGMLSGIYFALNEMKMSDYYSSLQNK